MKAKGPPWEESIYPLCQRQFCGYDFGFEHFAKQGSLLPRPKYIRCTHWIPNPLKIDYTPSNLVPKISIFLFWSDYKNLSSFTQTPAVLCSQLEFRTRLFTVSTKTLAIKSLIDCRLSNAKQKHKNLQTREQVEATNHTTIATCI